MHRVRSLTRKAITKNITFLKIIDYADIMHSYDLVPIAVETLGLSSSDTLTFVKQLRNTYIGEYREQSRDCIFIANTVNSNNSALQCNMFQ